MGKPVEKLLTAKADLAMEREQFTRDGLLDIVALEGGQTRQRR
jgi:hypothetical protein